MLPLSLGGVVDTHLRVYGTKNLRVVDAGIVPLVPASHMQSPIYAIAEKVRFCSFCNLNRSRFPAHSVQCFIQ